MKKILPLFIFLLFIFPETFARKIYTLKSPDGNLITEIRVAENITYTLVHAGDTLLYPSRISMETDKGIFGKNSKVKNIAHKKVNQAISSPFYKKKQIQDCYNELTIRFKEQYALVFRIYDEGMSYRFVSTGKEEFLVIREEAGFNFKKNCKAYIPYVKKTGTYEDQFFNTFENTYEYKPLNEWRSRQLAFLPLLVEGEKGKKIVITEADLENYPGMFLVNEEKKNILQPVHAPYPKRTAQGSHDKTVTVGGHNQVVLEREPYIARCKGGQHFPWRVLQVAEEAHKLTDSDLVYKLASPSRIEDVSWIKPGKVAWEWWHDWNLSGVDFETGVNMPTYKYYIDFASENNIEYVILDEGWYDKKQGNIFAVAPSLDLQELVAYASERQVGLILWAGYFVFDQAIEEACKHYSAMGIKGFKLDAIGRDDQLTNEFYYKSARLAAKYKLIVDFHGGAKPAGLNRTYPNVLNFEGVHGLEQLKAENYACDMVTYDVTMPFIRMVAGPVDYTQGAMRNGTKKSYRSVWSEPMSQGTRCRQLAEYILFESPLNMLCDSPVNYRKEQACLSFIASLPTIWDHTLALNGEIGRYLTMARKYKDDWYVGSLTNWDARILQLDLSFLGDGNFEAEVFSDGINAGRIAGDYIKEILPVPSNRKMNIRMAQGGGYVMRIYRK